MKLFILRLVFLTLYKIYVPINVSKYIFFIALPLILKYFNKRLDNYIKNI